MKRSSVRIYTILTVAAVILVTLWIFYNSSKDFVASHSDSNKITDIIDKYTITEKLPVKEHFIRKSAHLIEFGLLGSVLTVLTILAKVNFKKAMGGCILLYVLAVAVTDEFIQSMSDRTSSVADIFLDFSGALAGIVLILLSVYIIKKVKKAFLRRE